MSRVDTLRAFLANKPDDRFARYALALELKRAGDLDGAEAELRRLLAVHPGSGPGWLQLGTVLVERDRPDDALAAWQEGLAALAGLDDPDAKKAVGEIRAAIAAAE